MKCQKRWVDVFTSVDADADEYNEDIVYAEKKEVLCFNEAADDKGRSIVPAPLRRMRSISRNNCGSAIIEPVIPVKRAISETQSEVSRILDSFDNVINYRQYGDILEITVGGGRFR
ncbi:MAG: hypothetical protein ABIG84_06300 [archaeon]